MTMSSAGGQGRAAIVEGADVVTNDGQSIGSVKEARDGFFKVGASGQPDYWLADEFIVSSDRSRVRLRLSAVEVNGVRSDAPDAYGRETSRADLGIATERQTAISLRPGLRVYTYDGGYSGDVAEVQGEYFKIDRPSAPDFWLAMEDVQSSAGDRVTLTIHSGRMDHFRRKGPGAAPGV